MAKELIGVLDSIVKGVPKPAPNANKPRGAL